MTLSSLIPLLGLVTGLLPATTAFQSASAEEEDEGATLVVRVGTFENEDGRLGCRLFSNPAAFPDGSGRSRTATIDGTRGTCTFRNVEPGTCALAAIHDENANGRLDKNWVGMPTEGYGVSNNKTHAMSAPEWDESSFTVTAGERRTFNIRLRY